jgi:ketosteroid isomerase-like protein
MTDAEAVLAANDAFYRAFESLEMDRMRALWLPSATIVCIHPGWNALVGWPAVMESWEQIFAGTLAMQFVLADVSVVVHGDVAWVVCVEQIDSRGADGRAQARVQATNVFQCRDGRWWIVHHHGGPLFDTRPRKTSAPPLQ